MAAETPSDVPSIGQLLQADVKNHLRYRISREMGDLLENVDELRGLAAALEVFSDVSADANPDYLRETATGIRAIATQTFVCASKTSGICTRLQAWAEIAGIVFPTTSEDSTPEQSTSDRD